MEPESRLEYSRRLGLALSFIESRFTDGILLADIASAANFSPFHFHRIFTSLMEETPGEYLRRIRPEKAASLLYIHPERSITRIALDTGFSSSAAFSRAFQNHFRVSARTYRATVIPRKFPDIHTPSCDGNPPETETGFAPEEIRRISALHLAYTRSREGYGPAIEKAWGRLFAWAHPRGMIGPESRLFGIPMDDPDVTPENKCRYFAAVAVAEGTSINGHVEEMTLDAGWYAVFPYEGLMEGFTAFYKKVYGWWLPQSGYLPDDRPTLEAYPLADSAPSSRRNPRDRKFTFTLLLPIRPLS